MHIARRIYDLVLSVEILRRRGVIHPLRLGDSIRALRVAGKAGPFAAMIVPAVCHAPDSPALVDDRGTLTYGELEERSNALARGLSEIGLRTGDVAGILSRDHRGLVLSLIAAGKLGVRAVLMNTGFAKPQFADVAKREQVTAMLLDSEFVPLTDTLPASMPRALTRADTRTNVHQGIPTLDELIAGRSTAGTPMPSKPGGIVLLTSGTTGTPKGAPRDRISALQSAQLLHRIPFTQRGAMVIAAPLFHGTGLGQLAIGMTLGKKVVLRGLQFDPEATLADIATHRADALILVPTMLQRILDLGAETLARYDTSSLRIVVCAGSALPSDLCRRAASAFGDVLYNIYGSTEVANAAVATPVELRRAPGTVGRPPVGCRLVLYDDQRNRISAPDSPGAIFVSNGLSFAGYTDGDHKEVVDGLLCTGDVGHVDREGLLFIDGREDDMIVSGGENVFPGEVEDLLADRSDVRDVAVVGVDDHAFGKRLRAFVAPAADAELDTEQLKDYIKGNLARYKVPRDVILVDHIPRNPTGKVSRTELERLAGPGTG